MQGRRRLELFGEDHNIRPGWVTIGNALTGSNFSAQVPAAFPPPILSLLWQAKFAPISVIARCPAFHRLGCRHAVRTRYASCPGSASDAETQAASARDSAVTSAVCWYQGNGTMPTGACLEYSACSKAAGDTCTCGGATSLSVNECPRTTGTATSELSRRPLRRRTRPTSRTRAGGRTSAAAAGRRLERRTWSARLPRSRSCAPSPPDARGL